MTACTDLHWTGTRCDKEAGHKGRHGGINPQGTWEDWL